MPHPPIASSRAGVLSAFALVATCFFASAHAGLPEAQALLQQGQHTQALDQAERAIAANPKDRQARFLKGVILAEMNRLDEATTVFIKLTEEAPELPEPYNNLAVIYAQQKQYDKAKAALEMAIRTHPSYAVAHENLGDLYAKLARQAYDRALQIDAGNSAAQAKLNLIREIISVGARPGSTPVAARPATADRATVALATPPAPKPAATPVSPVPTPAAKPAAPASAAPAQSVVASKPTPPAASAAATPVAPVPATAAASKPAAKPEVADARDKDKDRDADKEKDKLKDEQKAVRAAAQAWATAWSSKNVKEYLSWYARDFDVPDGKSRSAWEKERTERVGKPGAIKVTLSEVDVVIKGEQATVRFKQNYSSASFSSASGKTLVMVHHNGRWQIQQERIGR